MLRRRIHITGIVQGVGFRPFVYREAMRRGITGWVLNAGDGVHVEAWAADVGTLDAFTHALANDAPSAARVERVEVEADGGAGQDLPTDDEAPAAFTIRHSDAGTARTTLVSPDIATCPDCVRELFDPSDRRYHYPFINCTNCGPRFTIIRSLPYDRAATSMAPFPMCPRCAAEYADPAERRFHAQPDACFDCGPHITWRVRGEQGDRADGALSIGDALDRARQAPARGNTREESDAIIEACAALLGAGGIIAVKGIGGFHLACDAGNEGAVRELRRRKRRSNKPLAVMLRTVDEATGICQVSKLERALLTGAARPIVLLRRKTVDERAAGGMILAPSVAFDLPELGVMLPYTPLQHLLLAACAAQGTRALVMTSGNLSEEPIETDDALAWERLVESGIADALLGNDRAILSRYDDSVVRVVDGMEMPVRRARGYAPSPLALPRLGGKRATVLACGPEQKATLAFTREEDSGEASCFVSQHIGDVENGGTFAAWNEARTRLEGLFDLRPEALACDLHPGYLPSQWAREQARAEGLPLVEVQHHHAHIASVITEAAAGGRIDPAAAVIGIALDGTGAGTDGSVWGGEVLVATLGSFARAGHLAPWRLPGGAASVRDPRRNALALLMACGLQDAAGARTMLDELGESTCSVTRTMVERGINSPLTSSMGRFLDAIAALTGICGTATYEGEPAIRLEAAAWRAAAGELAEAGAGDTDADGYELALVSHHASEDAGRDACRERPGNALAADAEAAARARVGQVALDMLAPGAEPFVLDPAPLIESVLADLAAGTSPGLIALRVHTAVADGVAAAALRTARESGLATVALSGGVWMNRMLLAGVRARLEREGITVLIPRTVPVNDGCIAYGQAAVARTRVGWDS